LRASGDVVGLLCLKDERLSEAYASDEIAALIMVADQLAINVENSRLFGLLRERDRLATLGEMSAGLAHEVRNPLAAIKAAVQEIDPQQFQNSDDRELFDVILNEVDRLNTVVTQFLDYARPFRGTFAPLAPNYAVRRTLQLMGRHLGEDIDVELDLEPELPDVNGDAEQMQQVMINLVLNAAEAMERTGKIEISTRSTHGREVPMFGQESPKFVEVRVRDSGPGIPKSVREHLFIPFFTTKDRGTGLGLALCQRIVQHHGGAIEVHSVEGRGSTFVVRLPAVVRRHRVSLPEPAGVDQGGQDAPVDAHEGGQS
jgi:two-component system sensor histidine kinase HydH